MDTDDLIPSPGDSDSELVAKRVAAQPPEGRLGIAQPEAVLQVGDDMVRLAAPIAKAAHQLAGMGDLRRLVPPAHLASGKFEYMQGKAIIVHRDSRKIAGHAEVQNVGLAGAQAALAFQVLAAATQQYYLHEINGQLEAIDTRVESIEARQQTTTLGDLLGIEREVHDLRERRLRGLVQDGETALLREWSAQARGELESLSTLMEHHFKRDHDAHRRRAYIKRLESLGGAPARDFENVLVAGRVLLTIREELLARASSAEDLDQLLTRNEEIASEVLGQLTAAAEPFADTLERAHEYDDAPYVAEVAVDFARKFSERAIPSEKLRRFGGRVLTAPSRYAPAVKAADATVGKALRADESRRDARIADFKRRTHAAQKVAAVDLTTTNVELEVRELPDGELELSLHPQELPG